MKTTKQLLSALLCLAVLLCAFTACGKDPAPENSWENAVYTEDTALGEGAKTLSITVSMQENTVVFTVKTDADTLKDALLPLSLIQGEQQSAGYMVYYVNGVRADYNEDGAYWAIMQGDDYLMTGVDTTPIADGDSYAFVYTEA